jgi:hypothetical protein
VAVKRIIHIPMVTQAGFAPLENSDLAGEQYHRVIGFHTIVVDLLFKPDISALGPIYDDGGIYR